MDAFWKTVNCQALENIDWFTDDCKCGFCVSGHILQQGIRLRIFCIVGLEKCLTDVMLLSFPGELLWIPPSLDYGNCRNHSWLKASGGIRLLCLRQGKRGTALPSILLNCAMLGNVLASMLSNCTMGDMKMDAPNFRISKVLMRDTSSYSFTAMERTVCWSAFTRFGCGVPSSSKVPFQTASTWICCQDIGMCHTFACRLRDLLEVPWLDNTGCAMNLVAREVHVLVVEFPGYGLCPGKPSEARFRWSSSDTSPESKQMPRVGQDSLDSAADVCFRYVREVAFIAVIENKSAKHRCAHVSICIIMIHYVSLCSNIMYQ